MGNTDHKVITHSINLDKFRTGTGYPKVKNSLYQDTSFISKVNAMITKTLPSHPDTRAENLLYLILFNTSPIATQHLKEAKDAHYANINYLNTEIKTTQLDSILFVHPM